MKKYICTVCDWVYDPDKVTLTVAFCLALLLKIFPTIGFALFVG